MSKKPTAVIGWRSKLTGYAGHGSPIDRKSAELIRDQAQKDFPDIDHFLIPSKAPSNDGARG